MKPGSSVKRLSCADNGKDLAFRNQSQPKSDTPAPDFLHTFPEGPPGSSPGACSTRASLQAPNTVKGKGPFGADPARPALRHAPHPSRLPRARGGFGYGSCTIVSCLLLCYMLQRMCVYKDTRFLTISDPFAAVPPSRRHEEPGCTPPTENSLQSGLPWRWTRCWECFMQSLMGLDGPQKYHQGDPRPRPPQGFATSK